MERILEVPLDNLVLSALDVRRHLGDLKPTLQAIRKYGVVEPLLVRPVNGKYEVIARALLYATARHMRLRAIPCVVLDITDSEAAELSLSIEGLQHDKLDLEDRVQSYERIQTLNPRCGSISALAKVIGKRRSAIVQDQAAYEALQVLKPHGIRVARGLHPNSGDRMERRAIPERHATMLTQTMTKVTDTLQNDVPAQKWVELAKAIAPMKGEEAKKVLASFAVDPDEPLDEPTQDQKKSKWLNLPLSWSTLQALEELARNSQAPSITAYVERIVERERLAQSEALC